MNQAVFLVLVLLLTAPATIGAQSVVTAYADGQVLLRQAFPVRIPAGKSQQAVFIGDCDPGSITVDDARVTVLGARYEHASNEASVIRRSVGQRVTFRLPQTRDSLTATVRSVDPLQLQLDDGRFLFASPGIPLYPATAVQAGQQLTLTLQAARAVDSLWVACTTSGLGWSAEYEVDIGPRESRLKSIAVLRSSHLSVRDAAVRLVAGTVQRSAALVRDDAGRPLHSLQPEAENWLDRAIMVSARSSDRGGQSVNSLALRVGETQTYPLPGRYDLVPGATTLAPLLEPTPVTVERSYVVPGRMPAQGDLYASNQTDDVIPSVLYTVTRVKGAGVSDVRLPPGGVRLYAPAPDGLRQLIGEVTAGSLAPGERMLLVAGPAFGLSATRRDFNAGVEQDTLREPFRVRRSATLISYEVTIRNTADSAAVVDVVERRAAPWSVVESTVAPERLSASETRFRITVPARTTRVVSYRLRAPVQQP